MTPPKGSKFKPIWNIGCTVASYIFNLELIRKEQIPETDRSYYYESKIGNYTVFCTTDGGKVVLDAPPDRRKDPIATNNERCYQTIMAQIDHRLYSIGFFSQGNVFGMFVAHSFILGRTLSQ